MPVDAKRVQELIDELGLEGADKDYFAKVLTTNEKAATQFVGQRERHDLLTRRTQQLSEKERELERRANEQITGYAQQLQQAEERIRKIMSDFEALEISKTKAESLLRKVKEVYNLSDEDIPKIQDTVKPPGNGNPPVNLDIDKKLEDFKNALLKELNPNFALLPRITAIQNEIYARHLELTGKRLQQKEMEALMAEAQAENGPTLVQAWRDKYKIDEIEKQREREEWSKADRQKWEDELKARNSEAALRQVRSTPDGVAKHLSPVFREYKRQDDLVAAKPAEPAKPPERVPAVQNEPKLSGAERAARKWIERRGAGIPLGKEESVGRT